MTIKMRRKISRLSNEYYTTRGYGLLYQIFDKYPEAEQIDDKIFAVFGRLERIGFDYPRRHREKDKDYQYRIRKIYRKYDKTISSYIEQMNDMIDEAAGIDKNQELEN